VTELIVADTETGGLNPSTDALLTVALVHWIDGTLLERVEFKVRTEGRRVTPEALAVNRIVLVEHERDALPRSVVADLLVRWVRLQWRGSGGKGKGGKAGRARLAAHNLAFDLGFLRELVPDDEWGRIFSHHGLCTMQIMEFLEAARLVPESVGGGLDRAVDYFGIEIPEAARHTALGDCVAAAQLLTAMTEHVQPPKGWRQFFSRRVSEAIA
jgi:DNA polymerase-3 subunit epsilon